MASQGHSRSHVLGLLESSQGISNAVILASTLKVMASESRPTKITVFNHATFVWRPLQETNMNCLKVESLSKIPFCCWEHGSIFCQISVVYSERRIIVAIKCCVAVQAHPRSSLILVATESVYTTSYYWSTVTCPISHRFCRYGWKSPIYPTPAIYRFRSGWLFSICWKSFLYLETRVVQGPDGEDFVIVACVVWTKSGFDEHTDGRTYTFAVAKTRHLHSKIWHDHVDCGGDKGRRWLYYTASNVSLRLRLRIIVSCLLSQLVLAKCQHLLFMSDVQTVLLAATVLPHRSSVSVDQANTSHPHPTAAAAGAAAAAFAPCVTVKYHKCLS